MRERLENCIPSPNMSVASGEIERVEEQGSGSRGGRRNEGDMIRSCST